MKHSHFEFHKFSLLLLFVTNFIFYCQGDCELNSADVSKKEKKLLDTIRPLQGNVFEFKDAINSSEYSYKVSICSPIDGTAKGVGAAQFTAEKKKYDLGMYSKASIMGGTDWVLLTYSGGNEYGNHCNQTERIARIMIICDPDVLYGTMQVIEERTHSKESQASECYYLFELGSNVTCSITPKVPHGLSSGSVLCILFFVSALLYLSCGFLYKRIVVGAQGFEQIPNYGFWKDFGNLQADGCDYFCRCASRQESQAYRGIDDQSHEEDERDDQLLNM